MPRRPGPLSRRQTPRHGHVPYPFSTKTICDTADHILRCHLNDLDHGQVETTWHQDKYHLGVSRSFPRCRCGLSQLPTRGACEWSVPSNARTIGCRRRARDNSRSFECSEEGRVGEEDCCQLVLKEHVHNWLYEMAWMDRHQIDHGNS
jgi:hypothetical protein